MTHYLSFSLSSLAKRKIPTKKPKIIETGLGTVEYRNVASLVDVAVYPVVDEVLEKANNGAVFREVHRDPSTNH